MKSPQSNDKPFVGIQVDATAREGRSPGDLIEAIQLHAPVNALVCFYKEHELRRRLPVEIDELFYGPTTAMRKTDWVDELCAEGERRGVGVYLGGGESDWRLYGGPFAGFERAAQVDCFGRPSQLMTCVNRPDWRKYQSALHASIFAEHPELSGFLFMHERCGPMQQLLHPDSWQGEFNPVCFCKACRNLAQAQGIDADRAAAGMRQLVDLFKARRRDLVRDGVFTGFWRTLLEFPEIFAWEAFQWESLQGYRSEVADAIRGALPGATVGYHFQHGSMNGNLPWRAGDKPERVAEYADWVKASVYPACSGSRYRNQIKLARRSWLADLDDEAAHLAVTGWFGRNPEDGLASLVSPDDDTHSAYGAEWVKNETRRICEACAPKPHYAGLGIGIPGGEKADTPELIRSCAEACLEGGADGFLLSRHFSEMQPECLAAAGDVIETIMK